MKEQKLSHEIITFCQLLSVALRSGHPIPESLNQLCSGLPDSKASKWALDLAGKLAEGYSVDEACRELRDFDPVLARIMPLLGSHRLVAILELYTGFLVNLERVKENINTALFYPAMVTVLLVANLLHLNFDLFPHVYQQVAETSQSLPLMLRVLYFAELELWPVSLPVPLFIFFSCLMMLYTLVNPELTSHSPAAKLAGVTHALRLQEIGRIQGVVSLYLQAGQALTQAIEHAASMTVGGDAEALRKVAKALADGEEPALAFEFSDVLNHLPAAPEEHGMLADRLSYASGSNYRHSSRLLQQISQTMTLVMLLLTGVFVTLITSGVFGSYYWAIWSMI